MRTGGRAAVGLVGVLVAAVVLALVGVAEVPPAGAGTLDEIRGQLERVRAERQQLEERMEQTQQRLEELHARVDGLERERDALQREIDAHDRDVEELSDRVSHRVREVFKHGSTLDPVAVFLASDDAAGAINRAATVQRLVASDRSRTDELVATQVRAQAAREQLDERSRELEDTAEEFDELESSLQEDLEAVRRLESSLTSSERDELERLERERREEQERERREQQRQAQRAAEEARQAEQEAAEQEAAEQEREEVEPDEAADSGPTSSGSMYCPIGRPHSFIDSWGHARSGGRRHRGTDMMAPHGVAVYAVTDGTWEHRRPGASAGIWGVLRGDNGDHYWYLHLSGHTAPNGARVSGGEQIATNGSTGNATTPHLHFELHPGGGGAVNPYSLLRRLC